MPIALVTAAALIGRIYPIIRQVIRATRKKSAGGKKITLEERDEILAVAMGQFGDILEDVIPGGEDLIEDVVDVVDEATRNRRVTGR